MINKIIDLCAQPFIPDFFWRTEEHHRQGFWEFDVKKISLYFSEKQREGVIKWDEWRNDLVGKFTFNANVLDFLLANQYLIPEAWKNIKVFFSGTIYRHFGSDLRVRYLCFKDGIWQWGFAWVLDEFDINCQVATFKI